MFGLDGEFSGHVGFSLAEIDELFAEIGAAEHAAAVACVAFAPHHHGLMLAAGGADGVVRLYASQDRVSGWEEQVRLPACCGKDRC